MLVTINPNSPIYNEYGCEMATVCVEQLLNLWGGYATAWSLGLAGVDFGEEEGPAEHEVPQQYKERNGVWRYADAEMDGTASEFSSASPPAPTERDEESEGSEAATANASTHA